MDNINKPEELLDYMSNIKYGYLGKNGKIYYQDDSNFNKDWFNQYVLENKEEFINNQCGTCFDQVEFERDWFINNNYSVKTFYEMVLLDYDNNYPTHSFLIYKDNNKWCWFENADYNNRGIHKFDKLEELLEYQYNKYIELLKTFNISKEEINKIIITEFLKPKDNISAKEYIEYVTDSKRIK